VAIAVYFHETAMTLDAFNESHRRLSALGTAGLAELGLDPGRPDFEDRLGQSSASQTN